MSSARNALILLSRDVAPYEEFTIPVRQNGAPFAIEGDGSLTVYGDDGISASFPAQAWRGVIVGEAVES